LDLVALGVNHKTAPVEIREQLAFSEKQVKQVLQGLIQGDGLKECAVLSTCNRTEVYALAAGAEKVQSAFAGYLKVNRGLDPAGLRNFTYVYTGREAARHLFRVAAGLDSMILGETQILGQVKKAYEQAAACGTLDKVLHALFRRALECGKRVHSETEINQNSASVSYTAVKLAQDVFGQLAGCSVLVIGAGKMSELTLQHLHTHGCREMLIINRTRERAEALVALFGGKIFDYKSMGDCLVKADIVISSTGSPHFIIKKPLVAAAMRARKNRPLFFIDIAVPRDVDPAVNDLHNVYLYDIDDLQAVVDANIKEREREARKAELIIDQEVDEYCFWYKTLNVVPLIAALRQKAEKIRQEELAKMVGGCLSRLSPKEQKAVDNLTRLIVNRILREPVLKIKEFAAEERSEVYAASLCHLFDLDEDLLPKEEKLAAIMLFNGKNRHD